MVTLDARRTVFVADDDADLRQVLVQLLEHKGYNVVEAGDGGAALEYLAGAADGDGAMPDAILLDFAMPELSGIGIIRTLRRFVCVPPTILMTGFPDIHVDAFAHAVGIETILHKPLDAEQLLRVLDQVIVARGERNALLREREREPTSS